MTTLRTVTRLVCTAALAVAGGCAQLRAANATPQPMEGQLAATLRQADQEAIALRFGVADRLLAEFAESHAGTPEAVETAFWRAVFKLDTANQTGSRRDAVALLDGYLNGSTVVAHRGAALALRHAASAERTVVTVPASSTPTTPGTAPTARTDASAEEVQRLREELAKANAELERIRKRLSQPNP
jgi:transposase